MSFWKSKSDAGRDVLPGRAPEPDTQANGNPASPEENAASTTPELVDPKFLARAGGLTILAAAIACYLVFCVLFYQGQWQIVLHPEPMDFVPASAMPAHQDVHFAVTEGGQPTLFGWWIPADQGAAYANDVVVYFPSGSGSLSHRTDVLSFWHQQGIAVFAFDYRGFGNSAALHPDEETMNQDAANVARYLTDTRHVQPGRMVFLGESLGCMTAIHAANLVPGLAGVILQNPVMSELQTFESDSRADLLPLHLLLKSDYSLKPDIGNLQAQTLVLSSLGTQQEEAASLSVMDAIHAPRQYLEVPANGGLPILNHGVDAFLEATFPADAKATGAKPEDSGSGSGPAVPPEK